LERRLAITYAVSATATLCTACLAVATVSGGLFVSAAPAMKMGVRTVEHVDDYIVVHSPTTTAPAALPAVVVPQAYIVAPEPATTTAATDAPVVTPAPAPAPAPVVKAKPAAAPAPAPTMAEATVPESSEVPGPATRAPERKRQPTTESTSPEDRTPTTDPRSDDGHPSDDGVREGAGG
jgi:outer membrane biosynthesis protein TonB